MTLTVAAALEHRVGPHGYIHGWIKVADPMGSLAAHTSNLGHLSASREALHKKIVDEMLAGHKPEAHPTATFLGGGPASGKSSVIKVDPNSVHIDADEIKAKLPEYQTLLKRGDSHAAAYVHEESSQIAKRATHEAAARHLSYTLDGTGDSDYDKLLHKVGEARMGGHKVVAHYVTVDTDEAVRRSNARAAKTGRMVPETTIRVTHQQVTNTFARAAANNIFDEATLHDNNGTKPVLVGSKKPGGQWTVKNMNAWDRFLDKGTPEARQG